MHLIDSTAAARVEHQGNRETRVKGTWPVVPAVVVVAVVEATPSPTSAVPELSTAPLPTSPVTAAAR